jgi:hypothetical protein
MNDRTTLLREIHEAWQAYAAALAACADDDLLGIADGTWTRKDLVAHVAWWEGSSSDALEAVTAGRDPAWRNESTDATNARVEAEHKDLPVAEVRRLAAAAHERLLATIGAASDEDLFTAGRFPWMNGAALVEMVRGDTSQHYPEHAGHLAEHR